MRILLDEKSPGGVGGGPSGSRDTRCARLATGSKWQLLRLAEGHFDLLLTMDKGILYRQNHRNRRMRIAVLSAHNSRIESIMPLVPNLRDFIESSLPGTLAIIHVDSVEVVASSPNDIP